jgi:DNA-binding MarR family transcriptional regulator
MPPSPHAESFGFLIADVGRLMRRAFQARLGDGPLTFAQARLLAYVERQQGLRQVELAELMEIQPITLARLIDQLADAGLVERRPDADDRRAYRLHLTDAAAPQLAAVRRIGTEIRAEAVAGLDEQDAARLAAMLRRMRDNLGAAPRRPDREG